MFLTQVPNAVETVAMSSIGMGYHHTCSTRLDNGMISCWGEDDDNRRNFPGGIVSHSVVGGKMFSCSIQDSNGYLICVGTGDARTDAPVSTAFSFLAAGCTCYLVIIRTVEWL